MKTCEKCSREYDEALEKCPYCTEDDEKINEEEKDDAAEENKDETDEATELDKAFEKAPARRGVSLKVKIIAAVAVVAIAVGGFFYYCHSRRQGIEKMVDTYLSAGQYGEAIAYIRSDRVKLIDTEENNQAYRAQLLQRVSTRIINEAQDLSEDGEHKKAVRLLKEYDIHSQVTLENNIRIIQDRCSHELEYKDKRAATCAREGVEILYCPICEYTETTVFEALPHTRGEIKVNVAATCDQAGESEAVCTVCGETEYIEIEKLPHKFEREEVVEEATCTEAGKKKGFCSVCGSESTEGIEPTGHSFRIVSSAPATCTEDGYEQKLCSLCGDTEYTELSSAGISHNYAETSRRNATCDSDGYIIYTCSVCGDAYDEIIPGGSSAHNYVVTSEIEPTCLSKGSVTYTCTVCGDAYTSEVTGDIEGLHLYNDLVIITNNTCTSDGLVRYTCVYCGDTFEKVLPKQEHTWMPANYGSPKTCRHCGATEGEPLEGYEFIAVNSLPQTFDGYDAFTHELRCTLRLNGIDCVIDDLEGDLYGNQGIRFHIFGDWELIYSAPGVFDGVEYYLTEVGVECIIKDANGEIVDEQYCSKMSVMYEYENGVETMRTGKIAWLENLEPGTYYVEVLSIICTDWDN